MDAASAGIQTYAARASRASFVPGALLGPDGLNLPLDLRSTNDLTPM